MKVAAESPSGFTLLELLMVIAIIGILSALLLPALAEARRKPLQIHCINNQKQIGSAMMMFADDNNQRIPGPCYMGVSRRYYEITRHFQKFGRGDEGGPTELVGYLANYLALPPPPHAPQKATGNVAVCPAFLKHAPNPPPNPRQEGYSYFCNRMKKMPPPEEWNTLLDLFEFPFGYLDGDFNVTRLPKSVHELARPSETWAIMDSDKISMTFGTWQTNLPNSRVHGKVWNRLYFDGHAASVKKLEQGEFWSDRQ